MNEEGKIMKKLSIHCAVLLACGLIAYGIAFSSQECGDVYPRESYPGAMDCGDGVVTLHDGLEVIDFILGRVDLSACQRLRADVPNGEPPNCTALNGVIDVMDGLVIMRMAAGETNCCDFFNKDSDHDGITDAEDNCIFLWNPNQEDTDEDGIGDVCECSADATCDGIVNLKDVTMLRKELGSDDCYGEDLCNCDFNGDGHVDVEDLSILRRDYGRKDCPLCQ